VYDPFSTTQQVIEQQLGPIKFPIFTVLKNELDKPNSVLVLDGEMESVFNEAIIPYIEHHSFKEHGVGNTNNGEQILIPLPNGVMESFKKNICIVYEVRSLKHSNPRLVSAVQVINTR
jgi:hypothetical protein